MTAAAGTRGHAVVLDRVTVDPAHSAAIGD
jgi:hypothetical protein